MIKGHGQREGMSLNVGETIFPVVASKELSNESVAFQMFPKLFSCIERQSKDFIRPEMG